MQIYAVDHALLGSQIIFNTLFIEIASQTQYQSYSLHE